MSKRNLSLPVFPILALLAASLIGASCAYESYRTTVLDPGFTLGSSSSLDKSPSFRQALQVLPGSKAFQEARIQYLLEQIAHSPYNFIRNGSRYSGERARAHFLWKYNLNRRFVVTAEDFIERVTTRSKLSGHTYVVELSGGKRYPLAPILARELARLDGEIAKHRKINTKENGFEFR